MRMEVGGLIRMSEKAKKRFKDDNYKVNDDGDQL